ncbi:MAG: hypothetical protein U0R44_06345 [Candidatus Micrarchaeia archaeon]
MGSSQQGMRKKEDIAEMINQILEQATKTRGGFTPEVVNQFYDEGQRARDERQRQQVREATPVRQPAQVVARRREESERRSEISPQMRRQGIEAAVDLGERLELAAAGRKLNLRDWVTSG